MDGGDWAAFVLGILGLSSAWWQLHRAGRHRIAAGRSRADARDHRALLLILTWCTSLFGLWAADQLLPRAWYGNPAWLTVVWTVSLLGGVAPPVLLVLMWLRRPTR